jgi:hypothetical protein
VVGEQHRYFAIRVPVYTATQLQPVEQWRHPQSGKTVRESGLSWIRDNRQSVSVVQPQRISSASAQQRILRQPRQGHIDRTGIATWDFSAFKDTPIREPLTLQFRAEIFNLLNRANFNTPNLIVFTPSGLSGTAGAITSTSTTSRQVQFGLKLLW